MKSSIVRFVAIVMMIVMVMPMVPVSSGPAETPRDFPEKFPSVIGPSNENPATDVNCERKVVRGNNGTLYAVFQRENEIWFSSSTDDGITWSTPANISNDNNRVNGRTSDQAAIATNGTAIFVVWADNSGWASNPVANAWVSFRRTNDSGLTWTPPLNQDPIHIATAPSWNWGGNFYALTVYEPSIVAYGINLTVAYHWQTGLWNPNAVLRSTSQNSGITWGASNTVSNTAQNAYSPTLAINNTTVYIAYEWAPTGGQRDIYIKILTNNGQTIPAGDGTRLTNNAGESMEPSIAVSGNRTYLVWQDNTAGNYEIYARVSSNNGLVWDPVVAQEGRNISASANNSVYPSVAEHGKDFYVMWQENGANRVSNLYMRANVSNAWQPTSQMTKGVEGNSWANMKEDSSSDYIEWIWTNKTATIWSPYYVLYDHLYVGSNTAPTLSWVGTQGYASDGIEPNIGTTGHTYVYRLKYTDADNDQPRASYPQVWMDRNMDKDYNDANEVYTMTALDPSDTTYTDGKVYTFSTLFDAVGTDYSYKFVAYDSVQKATGAPTGGTDGPDITSVNAVPTLEWTGEVGFAKDGVDPDMGSTQDTFTFHAKYTDRLNESPANGFPVLRLDLDGDGTYGGVADAQVPMTPLDPTDDTVSDGRIFVATHVFPVLGTSYHYQFYAEDLAGLNASTVSMPGPKITSTNAAPVLDWPSGAGYGTDGVDPDTGFISTPFMFRVLVKDAEGDKPLEVDLKVDMNSDGDFLDTGETVLMDPDPLTGTDYAAGVEHVVSKVLDAVGTYKYTFSATDKFGRDATGPAMAIKNITVAQNSPPVLSWLLTGGFESDGLNPENGDTNTTTFTYMVSYTDSDNESPAADFPKVWIDRNRDGKMADGEWYTMNATDPTNDKYDNGVAYHYETTFTELGMYSYAFDAQDIRGAPATGAPVSVRAGPYIAGLGVVTSPPVLSWLGTGNYSTSGVDPAKGSTATVFSFKVKYTDADGDLPASSSPKLLLDLDRNGVYANDALETRAMVEVDPADVTVQDGKIYMATATIGAMGSYNYTFSATSSRAKEAAFAPSILKGTIDVTSVNNAPNLGFLTGSATGLAPAAGTVGVTAFTYTVVYTDKDNDKPGTAGVTLKVDLDMEGTFTGTGEAIKMAEADASDTNVADGKTYKATVTFAKTGTSRYTFEASDGRGAIATGAPTGLFTGPVVNAVPPNHAPTFKFIGTGRYIQDGVDPTSGTPKTKFVFRIIYMDQDNDAPNYVNILVISGITSDTVMDYKTYNMTAATGAQNYTTGAEYTYTISLPVGDYHYQFVAKDVKGMEGKSAVLNGPVVKKTAPTTTGFLKDNLELALLILIAVVALIIGLAVGLSRKRKPEEPVERTSARPEARTVPEEGTDSGTKGMEPMDEEPEVEAPPKAPEPIVPKDEPKPEPKPEPEPPQEAPKESGRGEREDIKEEKPEEPPKGPKDGAKMDDEIDDILNKLEK
jgi:hypothetical protein